MRWIIRHSKGAQKPLVDVSDVQDLRGDRTGKAARRSPYRIQFCIRIDKGHMWETKVEIGDPHLVICEFGDCFPWAATETALIDDLQRPILHRGQCLLIREESGIICEDGVASNMILESGRGIASSARSQAY